MNEDIEYELLTKRIYQILLQLEGFDDIELKHNVKIKGKSNVEHQIDVYWEFKTAGVLHRVAIECKNYNSRISLGRIRDFHSVLQDVGNINGIIVTKSGFQSGVVEYAKHNGIMLKLLRNPIEEDWSGKIKKIEFNINVITTHVKEWKVNIDEEWFKLNYNKTKWENFELRISGINNEIWIVDSKGNNYKNFLDLEEGIPRNEKDEFDLIHKYEFDNHFIEAKGFGLLKLKDIVLKYDVISTVGEKIVIDAEQIVDKILRDMQTNEIRFIHKDGTIH